MRRIRRGSAFLVAFLLTVASTLFFVGCEGDSAETLIRNVILQVAGFYIPVEGATTIPGDNTGNPVTSLDLRQNGDQIEAIDNNGIIFKGTLGRVTEESASFTLNGQTTAGQEVTISGTISVGVGETDADMRGTWIEPTLFSPVAAQATVPQNNPPATNGVDDADGDMDGDALSISTDDDDNVIDITEDNTIEITASGGDGTFFFDLVNPSLGSLSGQTDVTDGTVTYTADITGEQVIIVTDGTGESVSVTIQQIDGSEP